MATDNHNADNNSTPGHTPGHTPGYTPGNIQGDARGSMGGVYQAGYGALHPWPAPMQVSKPENKFKPDMGDFVFALAAFLLGYLFSSWVFSSLRGWGVAAFTTLYLLAVTAYMKGKRVFTGGRAAWFWFAVTLVSGLSYAIWDNAGFIAVRIMFLFCSAVYYVIIASGSAILGKTGNYLLIDGINAVVILPFRNFINQYVSFSALRKGNRRGKILPVVLGAVLALILAAILIPLLRRADSGGFGVILDFFFDILRFIDVSVVFYAILAVPVAAYLYGLVSGVAFKKGTDLIKHGPTGKVVGALRVIPMATVYTVLGAVCAIYLVFILSQVPYFFSAFTGRRPLGWLVYSEYARQGFFELCGIASINLMVLTAGNLTGKKHRKDSITLKVFNIALAVITLVLIAAAFSKMALYIGAYGLTIPRLLPCLFMVFLAAVYLALIALQKVEFSIVRFALVTGSVMICALCLCNPDAIVVRYNTDRYISGTLHDFDTDVLYRAKSAGILPAIELYEETGDISLRMEIASYLRVCKMSYANINGASHTWSIESILARERLAGLFLPTETVVPCSTPAVIPK